MRAKLLAAALLFCSGTAFTQESQLPNNGGGGGGAGSPVVVMPFSANDLLVANSSGQVVDNSTAPSANLSVGLNSTANAVYATGAGVIAKLGTLTGGSAYTVGTAILSLGSITAGTLYTAGTYTAVSLTGGTGAGAQATIIVFGGGVVSVTLTANGTGYLITDVLSAAAASIGGTGSGFSIPVSTVGYPGVALTGGTGTSATANITVAAGGAVSAVALGNHGTGFTAGDSLTAPAASIGGTGSGFSVLVSTVGSVSSTLTEPMRVSSSASGVCADAATCLYNNYIINSDTVDVSGAANGSYGWSWQINYGGAGAKGAHRTAQFVLNVNNVPDDTIAAFYSTLNLISQASVNVGGTSGTGNGKGDLFGFNPYCRLIQGATNWSQCVGEEIDVSVHYGASVDQAIGLQIVQDGLFTVPPNQAATAYLAANASAASVGWDYLLTDGAYAGFPSIKSTGVVFRCYPHANTGNCGTIGSAFDLNSYTAITNFILRGPAANGSIDGNFNIKANSVAVTGTTIPAVGLYSPAAGVGGLSAASGLDIINFGQTSSTNWLIIGTNTAILNAGDNLEIRASANNAQGAMFKNVSATAAAQTYLYLASSTSNTQLQMVLNGGSFTGGLGANAFFISNGGTTGFELDGSGNPYLPSLVNATTAKTGSVCWNTGGGALTYDNSSTCLVSDADQKDIEGSLTGCIDKVKAIKSIKFFYKDRVASPDEHAGFTAQNIDAVEPLFAIRDENGKPIKVRYIEMAALWNCALQELESRIH
jgi:Chaperone of endosialidase